MWTSASFLRYFRYFWEIHSQKIASNICGMFHSIHGRRNCSNTEDSNSYNVHPEQQRCFTFRNANCLTPFQQQLMNKRYLQALERVTYLLPSEMHYGTWDISRGLSGAWQTPGRHMPSCSDSWKAQDLEDHPMSISEQPNELLTRPKKVTIGFLATWREKMQTHHVN